MSKDRTASLLARRYLGQLVAYARELVLVAVFAAICISVTAPIIIGSGAAIYWLSAQLGLEGPVRTAYFAVGVVVLMFEFAMLRRFVNGLSRAMLGPTRDPVI